MEYVAKTIQRIRKGSTRNVIILTITSDSGTKRVHEFGGYVSDAQAKQAVESFVGSQQSSLIVWR